MAAWYSGTIQARVGLGRVGSVWFGSARLGPIVIIRLNLAELGNKPERHPGDTEQDFGSAQDSAES